MHLKAFLDAFVKLKCTSLVLHLFLFIFCGNIIVWQNKQAVNFYFLDSNISRDIK